MKKLWLLRSHTILIATILKILFPIQYQVIEYNLIFSFYLNLLKYEFFKAPQIISHFKGMAWIDCMKRDHRNLQFSTEADLLTYEQQHSNINDWLDDQNTYIMSKNCVPCDWSRQGIFMMEYLKLLTPQENGQSFNVVVCSHLCGQ